MQYYCTVQQKSSLERHFNVPSMLHRYHERGLAWHAPCTPRCPCGPRLCSTALQTQCINLAPSVAAHPCCIRRRLHRVGLRRCVAPQHWAQLPPRSPTALAPASAAKRLAGGPRGIELQKSISQGSLELQYLQAVLTSLAPLHSNMQGGLKQSPDSNQAALLGAHLCGRDGHTATRIGWQAVCRHATWPCAVCRRVSMLRSLEARQSIAKPVSPCPGPQGISHTWRAKQGNALRATPQSSKNGAAGAATHQSFGPTLQEVAPIAAGLCSA